MKYLFIAVLLFSNHIFASRSIQLAYGTLNGIYLSISNPSTYEQTIDVVFKATGSHTLTAPAGTAGADGVTCPDNKTCKNKLAFRTLAANTSFSFGLAANGFYGNNFASANSGIIVTITVAEDEGYLIAGGSAQWSLNPGGMNSHIPFGGRPF